MSPGARCSLNNNGGGSCQANHAGFVLSGRMGVATDDGLQLEFGPNDVFDVGPGHDGWVVGDEPLVFVNWNGFRTWMPDANVTERVLLTLLFTDIVGSTELARSLGDLAGGAGIAFESRGEHQLKGLDGPRELFAAMEPSLVATRD